MTPPTLASVGCSSIAPCVATWPASPAGLPEGRIARANEFFAICWAVKYAHAECARLLIPVSAPKAEESLALRWTAGNGHAECVSLLIRRATPIGPPSSAISKRRRKLAAFRSSTIEQQELVAPPLSAGSMRRFPHSAPLIAVNPYRFEPAAWKARCPLAPTRSPPAAPSFRPGSLLPFTLWLACAGGDRASLIGSLRPPSSSAGVV